jgi:hypothetical protein
MRPLIQLHRAACGLAILLALAWLQAGLAADKLSTEPQNSALPAVAVDQLALGQFQYRTFLLVEETRMVIDSQRHLSRSQDEHGQQLLLETLTETGMGQTRDRLSLDAKSLLPMTREVRQHDGLMQVRYDNRAVSGQIRSGENLVGIDVQLDQPAFAGEAGLEATMAALPLSEGYTVGLRAVEVDIESLVRHFEIEVEAAETITVPAGEFEAWPVHLRALDGLGGDQWLWYTRYSPRFLIRAEGEIPEELGEGLLITELMAVEIR